MNYGADSIAKFIRAGEVATLVFDFDGTLYESSAGVEHQLRPLMVKTAAKTLGVAEEEARRILASYRQQYKASVLGLREHHGIDPELFLAEVYDSLDLSRMRPRRGLIEELTQLKGIIPLMIFTNSNRSFTHRAVKRLGLTDLFEQIITVEDNDFIRKPQIVAYEGLYRMLKLAPRRVAIFDDIASSLRIVKEMGSYAVLVGNGLREPPHFVDLHTGIEYDSAPQFVDAWTHDIVSFVAELNVRVGEGESSGNKDAVSGR